MIKIEKHFMDDGTECVPKLSVGDLIEFDWFGRTVRGPIEIIGVWGYWVKHGNGNGSVRCPFGRERKLTNETE